MRPYTPIDCNFYDELTLLAMRRRPCEVVYRDERDVEARVVDYVVDVFTRGDEEFIRLGDGDAIRLDHLVSVDGKALPTGCAPARSRK